MAEVTVASGATGSGIALSGSDQIFYVASGVVEFSTDGGATWVPFSSGDKVIFSDGLTVTPRNTGGAPAIFRHMSF